MKLLQLRLQNIRAFRSLNLSFADDVGKPKPWTLLLGDNASGKTTILRCLAIGSTDESSAAGLVREMKGSMVRKGTRRTDQGMILVGFLDSKGQPWTLKTILKPIAKTGDSVRQRAYKLHPDLVCDGPFPKKDRKEHVNLDKFPWDKLFVSGYGANRSIDGREEYTDYRTIDAVYTLFRYDQPLQSPELAWRRYRQRYQEKGPKSISVAKKIELADQRISKLLGSVMGFDEGENPMLEEEGIFLRQGRNKVPLVDNADGYRSVTTWLLDLLAWHLLFRKTPEIETVSGIVLVDETEQHLHPRWQRFIISRLHNQFPKLQFISTTHSPLCAASAADLSPDECSMILLSKKKGEVGAKELPLPYGERTDEILISSAFGLKETMNPELGKKVIQYRKLVKKMRKKPEDLELIENLRKELINFLPNAVLWEDEKIQKEYSKSIKRQFQI